MSGLVIGLFGSGEFEPWAEAADRWLLEHARSGDGRVLILPTASALEGDEVFDFWGSRGLEHYGSMGVPAEVVPLKTRDDAHRDDLIARLEPASLVFFSGGNPAELAATLRGTPFWTALLGAMERGVAYGGCSAGMACLGEVAPDSAVNEFTDALWRPGLGLLTNVMLGPHWDALDSFAPGLTQYIVTSVPAGCRLFAVDEDTAVVGDGTTWSVIGEGRAHLMLDGEWRHVPAGGVFDVSLVARARGAESVISRD